MSSASTRDVEVLAAGDRSSSGERLEPVGVDTTRHDGDRQLTAGGVLGLGGRIATGGDDVACPTERVRQRLLAERETAGHGDLGAVQHEVVGKFERWPDESERDGGVEHDEVGAEVAGEFVDLAHHERVREQDRFAGPLDPVRLVGVERRRVGVRAGEHGEPIGGKTTPPLPEQRLDAADLRWEVVGDEEVLHARHREVRRSSAHCACSARTGSGPER